jgi:hypothetical protein
MRRQVQQGLLSYRDTDGVWRHALKGESVDVAADDLERFDQLNFGPDYTPKVKGPATTEPSPTSRRSVKKAAAKKAGRAATPRKKA